MTDDRLKPKNLWKLAVEMHIAHGHSRADALEAVIVEWLMHGHTEPLLESVRTGEVDCAILELVALMLSQHPNLPCHLILQHRGGGRPPEPGLDRRNAMILLMYETLTRKGHSSKQVAHALADVFGITEDSILAAVRDHRKALIREQ
jgi:hypothetical protein